MSAVGEAGQLLARPPAGSGARWHRRAFGRLAHGAGERADLAPVAAIDEGAHDVPVGAAEGLRQTGAERRGPAFAGALLLGPQHRLEGLAGDPEAGAAVVDQVAAPADPDHVLVLGQVIADGAGAAIDEDAFAEREIGQVGDPHVLGDEDLVRGKLEGFREQGAHGGFRRRVAGEPGDARDDAERACRSSAPPGPCRRRSAARAPRRRRRRDGRSGDRRSLERRSAPFASASRQRVAVPPASMPSPSPMNLAPSSCQPARPALLDSSLLG